MCNAPGNSHFDAVVDCVGSIELCHKSSGYLKPGGKYISIEGSFFLQLKSNYLPDILGGTPRPYKSIMTYPSGALAEVVAGWFEKKWIKEVPVDSVFSMDDALQVIHPNKPINEKLNN